MQLDSFAANRSIPKMQITDIVTYHVHDRTWQQGKPYQSAMILLRVLTDEGITGVGQCYSVGADAGVIGTLENMKPWLIGQDPSRIEWLLRRAKNTMRFSLGPAAWAALSGIDIALWDIAGKAAGVPVYRLFGGPVRDRVRVYTHVGGATSEECAENARKLLAVGYTAFKVEPAMPQGWPEMPWRRVVRETEARVRATREAIGDGPDIAIDIHATLREPSKARQIINVTSPYRLLFVEEPALPHGIESTARQRRETVTPIATGENIFGLSRFSELLNADGVDIIQPDVIVCGGLLEMRKIAMLAEARYVTVAPHNPSGFISTAMSVHFAAITPNFIILEFGQDHLKPKAEFVDKAWAPVNGYLELQTKPGIGMELNLKAISAASGHPWDRGFPKHIDGSPAFI